MPRVLKRTPQWLVPPSPGSDLFGAKPKSPEANDGPKEQPYDGPSRTIAHGRGTEVFVAQGGELRWADLKALKDGFEEEEESDGRSKRKSTTWRYDGSFDNAYTVSLTIYLYAKHLTKILCSFSKLEDPAQFDN
jgi:hypothetical protein